MGNHGNEFLGLANAYALAVCLVQLAKVGDSLIHLQISLYQSCLILRWWILPQALHYYESATYFPSIEIVPTTPISHAGDASLLVTKGQRRLDSSTKPH
ncbi:hypothetical protein PAHAL_3G417700 [Panicum hallii]|jgi:hypothetical protein|uniref:Uncharacterized protein n=1 Tax=Panicum hallii TaxID=206008 RepID=A0A2T8KL54_9POAL|nr:hypothetical protein PAHAL_3G417700 [Panicum hallii]